MNFTQAIPKKWYIPVIFVLILNTVISVNQGFSQLNINYWKTMEMGPHLVGIQKMIYLDTSREYDYTFGDTTMSIQNQPKGRPLLINIFYPAKSTNKGREVTIEDLWKFEGDESFQHFLEKFESYEIDMAKMFAIHENLKLNDYKQKNSNHDSLINKLFVSYSTSTIYANKGLEISNNQLPIVIYHQGLGGTLDENLMLLEFLASHGFLVITSSFSTWHPGVGDTEASIQDIDFIIEKIVPRLSANETVYLMGHSFGANTIFNYPAIGKKKVTGIVPLDSDYGYAFTYYMTKDKQPDLEKQTNYESLPIFAVGRSEAHFRMIDLLDKSQRYFLKINGFQHNDFCSQTILGEAHCFPFSENQDKIRLKSRVYIKFCNQILHFLLSAMKNPTKVVRFYSMDPIEMNLEIPPKGKRSAYNSNFKPAIGKCPTSSQFLNIMNDKDIQLACREWLNCSNLKDTSFFNFEWLRLYDAILEDSSTDRAIYFLDFFSKHRNENLKLGGFAFYTCEKAFNDSGSGLHIYKAQEVFDWMIQNKPNEIDGYKGIILTKRVQEYYATENDQLNLKKELINSCKEFLRKFPNYFELPIDNHWDETIQRIIRKNTEGN
jgi:pimeloyl-ACP methyl ester carboxylesterase